MDLTTPLTELKRVGTVTSTNLRRLDLETVGDLLFYFPFRYDDFSLSGSIVNLKAGETATITAQIELIQNKRSPRRRMNITEALVNDGTEMLKVIWFNQPFLTRTLKVGDMVSLAGRVTEDFSGLIMTSPVYEKASGSAAIHTRGLVPIYHLTTAISQKQLRGAIAQVVNLADSIPDWLPSELVTRHGLMSLGQAVRAIHFPKDEADLAAAKQRLGFNELFLMQLRAQRQRREFLSLTAPVVPFAKDETKRFVASLPFDLTAGQKSSAWEIVQDMGQAKPMLRLLQGDVGSGKTVVACLAALNVALAHKQAAFMVPTEILAFQHFQTVTTKLFKDEPISVALFTRSYRLIRRPGKPVEELTKAEMLTALSKGEVGLVIGTHALIQETVAFKDLAYVIIDEQHRFGVEQRGMLAGKIGEGRMPHLLSMTATPIPRSLALALYGDLDVSIIKELPAGRKKIETKLVPEKGREAAYAFIANELDAGRQAFIVCPLIDPSDKLGARSVTMEHKRLNDSVFKKYRVGLLHGRLKSAEREDVMREFAAGTIDVLVATSVIEIGVDIPNATVMMVEDADRFGLAQLHQYRGRVGRSDFQSYCFLMSDSAEARSQERLASLITYDSGFDLARADLKFRGPGEVYGLVQKGFPELKMANFYDVELIKKAREAALAVLERDADLRSLPQLRRELGDFEERAHLE